MRKTKKMLLVLAAALSLAAAAAACSKKTEETTTQATQATSSTAESTQAESSTALTAPASYGKVTLGAYKGIEITEVAVEVTDEEVEAEIQMLLEQNPDVEVVTDRAVAAEDIVNIDFVGKKDGVAFEGGSSEAYPLQIGSGTFIPGFEDALIGMKIGETRDINLTFPEDYQSAELAGKDVVFTVTVNGIEKYTPAVLDDAFAAKVSQGEQTTVAELKAAIKADLEAGKKRKAMYTEQNEAMTIVVGNASFELNAEAVAYEKAWQLEQLKKSAEMYGMDYESLLSAYGTTAEEFEKQMEVYAEDVVKSKLVADEIVKTEKLEITDAIYEALAELEGVDVESLKSLYGEDMMETAAKRYVALQFVLDNAKKVSRNYNELEIPAATTTAQ